MHSFLSLFLASLAPLALYPSDREHAHILYRTAGVIYLEPIVNSSLGLNENVDRQSQGKNFLSFFLFVYLFFFFQVAAHHSQLAAGTAARGTGSRAGSKGQEGVLYGTQWPRLWRPCSEKCGPLQLTSGIFRGNSFPSFFFCPRKAYFST